METKEIADTRSLKIRKAVGYARFSTSMQRQESIDFQVRSIKKYCEENGFILLTTYADTAISGTTDKRPQFLKMISDIESREDIDAVVVYNLSRFSRSRYDSAMYRHILKKHGTKLISVMEKMSDGPEDVLMQSVLEGLSEFYVLKLKQDIRAGLAENALQCKATGGPPPLGYSVDPVTKKFIINEHEAGAVRLIFDMYISGNSYSEIISTLNGKGYKTRRGVDFAKNSLYEILRNEKYAGIYTYVKDTSKNSTGKYVRHGGEYEADSIIRIEGGIPAIVSKEDFDKAQEKLAERKHKGARFSAKQEYLLSGKIFCGECGSPFAGNSRRPDATHPMYVSYKCTRHNQRDEKCRNPEINREKVEGAVIKKLSSVIFNPNVIPALVCEYNDYISQKSGSAKSTLESLKKELVSVENKISKAVDLMIETGSAAMKAKLAELEAGKEKLTFEISRLEIELGREQYTEEMVRELFVAAEKQLRNGTLANRRAVIEQYVDKVVVYPEKIEIYLKIMGDFEMKEVVAVK